MRFDKVKAYKGANNQSIRGLGDVVKKLIEPIEKMAPEQIRLKMQGCGGCKDRQAKLNQLFPNPFG